MVEIHVHTVFMYDNVIVQNRSLARSGIWFGQIGILIWPGQIPDLAKLIHVFSLARFQVFV